MIFKYCDFCGKILLDNNLSYELKLPIIKSKIICDKENDTMKVILKPYIDIEESILCEECCKELANKRKTDWNFNEI